MIINYDLPNAVNGMIEYIHRVGRCGRFGRQGIAINFVREEQERTIDEIANHYNIKIDDLPQDVGEIM